MASYEPAQNALHVHERYDEFSNVEQIEWKPQLEFKSLKPTKIFLRVIRHIRPDNSQEELSEVR
jgi:hypothetical protein